MVNEWLQQAIRAGTVGGGSIGDFPRLVWHRADDVCYEAYLSNSGLGEYKGYPLGEGERPDGM